MEEIKISELERKCLIALVKAHHEYGGDYEDWCLYMKQIAADAEIDIKQVRRPVRSLARKGLTKYVRGLMTEDGEVAGSGYCATKLAVEMLTCISCGYDIATKSSHRCDNCERAHQLL